jgi:hypothetical protein
MFLLMGLGIGFGVGAGAGVLIAVLIIIVIGLAMLIPMIFPIIALFIGYFKIYKPISNDEYSENTKVFIIINIVICFIFGGGWFGWIAAILYIILLVSWDDLAHPERKTYYHGPPPAEYPRGEKPRSKKKTS